MLRFKLKKWLNKRRVIKSEKLLDKVYGKGTVNRIAMQYDGVAYAISNYTEKNPKNNLFVYVDEHKDITYEGQLMWDFYQYYIDICWDDKSEWRDYYWYKTNYKIVDGIDKVREKYDKEYSYEKTNENNNN